MTKLPPALLDALPSLEEVRAEIARRHIARLEEEHALRQLAELEQER
jgi:hypothetical protein